MVRRTGIVAVMVGLGLAVGACSGTDGGPQVASVGGTPSGTTPASSEVGEYLESIRAWAACMREHGFEFTEPDERGNVVFEGDATKGSPQYVAALQACEALRLPAPEELFEYPPLSDEETGRAQAYAECMQANGAPDFPDPMADGYFPRDNHWDSQSEDANRAARICAELGYGDTPGPGQG